MDLQKYINMPNANIPEEISVKISKAGGNTPTDFANRESILYDRALQDEVGFVKMPNGDYLVSMICPMPNITADMIRWWFWWHTQDSKRYQAWYPGEHFRISYKDKEYFESDTLPAFKPNSQYPIEKIGKINMPLRIDFVTSEEFGFSREALDENNVEIVICGHVGAFNDFIPHTEMAHIFFKDVDGVRMISRFWIGKRMRISFSEKSS